MIAIRKLARMVQSCGLNREVGHGIARMNPMALAAVVNNAICCLHAHLRPEIRQMITNSRAEHRQQARGVQGEEPDRAAAIGSDNVGAQICFGKMRDTRRAVDFKWNQTDPGLAIEGIESKARWN